RSASISRLRASVAGCAANVSISLSSAAIGSSKSRVSGTTPPRSGTTKVRRDLRGLGCSSALRGSVAFSPQLHGAGADDLFDVADKRRRRSDPYLRADVHLHAQPMRRLAGLDLERDLPVAAMLREDLAERFERSAVRRLLQVDRHLARDPLADAVERRDLGRQDSRALIVFFEPATHEQQLSGFDQAGRALVGFREPDDLHAADAILEL